MPPFSDVISHGQRPEEVLYKGDTIAAIPLAIIAHVDAGGAGIIASSSGLFKAAAHYYAQSCYPSRTFDSPLFPVY